MERNNSEIDRLDARGPDMMNPPATTTHPPAVLVTGASTGIGMACAIDLDRRGLRVFAGVRNVADGQRLQSEASERLRPILLDVTDAAAVQSAAETIGKTLGQAGLSGLVNNAGILVPGPLECVSPASFREQLEVNVLGTHAVTQAMLPLLRTAKGRIVMVGSIAGRVAVPFLGAYVTSKFALEAITDVLRIELKRFGIRVAIVEPDSVATPIWSKLRRQTDQLGESLQDAHAPLYANEVDELQEAGRRLHRRGMPVERVVGAIRHALLARRPRSRYPLGWRTRLAGCSAGLVPDGIRDWFVLRLMGT